MTFEENLERYRVLLEDLERREIPAPPGRPDENDNDEDNDDDPPSTSCLTNGCTSGAHIPTHATQSSIFNLSNSAPKSQRRWDADQL
jgi:hypothetical protein